jgi:hypothetical protein
MIESSITDCLQTGEIHHEPNANLPAKASDVSHQPEIRNKWHPPTVEWSVATEGTTMFLRIVGLSALLISLATSTMAQGTDSPSGDPTGTSKGTASDANPVGKPVGKEPAMIDPRSTGSKKLDARATIDCGTSAKAKSATAMHANKPTKTTCK